MYYNGKEAAEAMKNPNPEVKAVNETTPQFRNIFIRNITCKGAADALKIQGLPEMPIENIVIENAVIEAKNGVTCMAGKGILLKNVTLLTDSKDNVKVKNSSSVVVNGVKY
jgi:hypothetical protein